ncbi:hypothetical protein D3C78_915280 [compost metagenome]
MQEDDQGTLAFLDVVHLDAVDFGEAVREGVGVVDVPLGHAVGMFQVHRKYSSNYCCEGLA